MKFRIQSLWAFLAIEDDEEGVCAELVGNVWHPMIGADETRRVLLREKAIELSKLHGKRIKMVRFVRGQELETFEGGQ